MRIKKRRRSLNNWPKASIKKSKLCQGDSKLRKRKPDGFQERSLKKKLKRIPGRGEKVWKSFGELEQIPDGVKLKEQTERGMRGGEQWPKRRTRKGSSLLRSVRLEK